MMESSLDPLEVQEDADKQLIEDSGDSYWAARRKRKRENRLANKSLPSKNVKTNQEDTPSIRNMTQNKSSNNWKNLEINEIKFFNPTIVIDCSYETHMNEKRLKSLAAQIQCSYSSIKKSNRPLKLVVSSLTEGSKTLDFLKKYDGFETWKLFKESTSVEELYPIEQLVFLSPDSPNSIKELDESKVYVIGGIVDDNQLKGLSLKKAESLGISTAKLPIKDLIPNFKNQSLNINHIAIPKVVDILVALADSGNLQQSVESYVPRRYQIEKPSWPPKKPKSDAEKAEI